MLFCILGYQHTAITLESLLIFRFTASSYAKVAELADALDLGSSGVTRAGSSPAFRTSYQGTSGLSFADSKRWVGWFIDLITINSLEV